MSLLETISLAVERTPEVLDFSGFGEVTVGGIETGFGFAAPAQPVQFQPPSPAVFQPQPIRGTMNTNPQPSFGNPPMTSKTPPPEAQTYGSVSLIRPPTGPTSQPVQFQQPNPFQTQSMNQPPGGFSTIFSPIFQ